MSALLIQAQKDGMMSHNINKQLSRSTIYSIRQDIKETGDKYYKSMHSL